MCEWFLAHYDALKDFAGPLVSALGFLITGTLAGIGLNTFSRWKRQKLEEKRIELAIDALAIAYEAKFVFERLRVRFVRIYDDVGSGESAELRGPQAVLERIYANKEFFDKVWKLEPQFMAVFGADAEKIFELLHQARRNLEIKAEALIEEHHIEIDRNDLEGRERRRKLRSDIFARSVMLGGSIRMAIPATNTRGSDGVAAPD